MKIDERIAYGLNLTDPTSDKKFGFGIAVSDLVVTPLA
jgi:hypothetical protein